MRTFHSTGSGGQKLILNSRELTGTRRLISPRGTIFHGGIPPARREQARAPWSLFLFSCALALIPVATAQAMFAGMLHRPKFMSDLADPAPALERLMESISKIDVGSDLEGENLVPPAVDTGEPSFHPSRILVRFRDDADDQRQQSIHRAADALRVARRYKHVRGLQLVNVPSGRVMQSLNVYRGDASVLYAEPDFDVHLVEIPGDPVFNRQWGMRNTGQTYDGLFCDRIGVVGEDIDAARAWDFWTGDPEFRIAIIDTGVNHLHPDLAANVWTNAGEIPDNNTDDDGNGWVDDVHGFDTFNVDGDPFDGNSHGSHVAGIIAAAGDNGVGVAGVNWHAKIVALQMFPDSGRGANVSEAIEAMEYVIDNGIRVSNNSWGFTGYSQSMYDVIEASQSVGHLFVTAAGNNFRRNIDLQPQYPAAYDLPNILTVAAINNAGNLATFSNVGFRGVDIAAPGACIFSTVLSAGYGFKDGTSMATPHATGVVALLMSRLPSLDWRQVKERILATARPQESLAGLCVSGGVLNAASAVWDCNRNGIADEDDIASGLSVDCNGNLLPDECEPDCNANGSADGCDIDGGQSLDCDGNRIPDECDPDCNRNGIPDFCDLRDGTSIDCAAARNNIPDECDPDCNQNGVSDFCDVATLQSPDCNGNLVPDSCEPGGLLDCNKNMLVDLCDISRRTSLDCNDNAIPDECDLGGGELEDCTENGVPDVCESDCNMNEEADSCDIASEISQDVNANRIPDECPADGLGFALVPVHATGEHVIDGNEIRLAQGGQFVTLEIRISGWDPDLNFDPRLRAYQAQIDSDGFTSGLFGELRLATVPCAGEEDCVGPQATCQADGFCNDWGSAYIDITHPNFVFFNLPVLPVVNLISVAPDFWLVSALFNQSDAVADPGLDRYAGTIIVDVPQGTGGTFTIGFEEAGSLYRQATGVGIAIPSLTPARITIPADCNENGVSDDRDIASGESEDCDRNGVPDECLAIEGDCNQNGIVDACDILGGFSEDCGGNGVPDECLVEEGDCNNNGVPDECDILSGFSEDCDESEVPDECETGGDQDCNQNGVSDLCDVWFGASSDCNDNGLPDECDVANSTSQDCARNGIPDECEGDCNENGFADSCDIFRGRSPDIDENGVPDECHRILRVPQQYATIQAAINAAMDGDSVMVNPGTYFENIDFRGGFSSSKQILVKGRTGAAETIIDGGGLSSVVTFGGTTTLGSQLSGFTITNGGGRPGGGIFIGMGSPTIRNCHIVNNVHLGSGGGIHSINGSPRIEDCLIAGNSATSTGGGALFQDGSPVLLRCVFEKNSSNVHAGGIALNGANAMLDFCTLAENQTTRRGGGIFCRNASTARITSCTIRGNSAMEGGGIHCSSSSPIVRTSSILENTAVDGGGAFLFLSSPQFDRCRFEGNRATRGGAMHALDQSRPTMTTCLLASNSAESEGGGIYFTTGGRLTLSRSTIAGNSAGGSGKAMSIRRGGQIVQDNSVVWGDPNDADQIFLSDAEASIVSNFSNVQGGSAGVAGEGMVTWQSGNIQDDPLFVDPDGPDEDGATWNDNDFHLTATSPNRNAGNPSSPTSASAQDMDGERRLGGGRLDIGADEFHDCNENEAADRLDISAAFSADCNGNRIPDECDLLTQDCNDNGFVDGCERYGDIDGNSVVDIDDVVCVLNAMSDPGVCPEGDIAPCAGDGFVDMLDLSAVLDAYLGVGLCSVCP